jgi:hypothetical protein
LSDEISFFLGGVGMKRTEYFLIMF